MLFNRDDFKPFEGAEDFYKSVREVIEKLKEHGFHKESKFVDDAYRYPGSTGGEIVPRIFAACREQKRNQRIPREIRHEMARIIYAVLQWCPGLNWQGDELDY
jgi:SOS response regulatory protein OraA/RecX